MGLSFSVYHQFVRSQLLYLTIYSETLAWDTEWPSGSWVPNIFLPTSSWWSGLTTPALVVSSFCTCCSTATGKRDQVAVLAFDLVELLLYPLTAVSLFQDLGLWDPHNLKFWRWESQIPQVCHCEWWSAGWLLTSMSWFSNLCILPIGDTAPCDGNWFKNYTTSLRMTPHHCKVISKQEP